MNTFDEIIQTKAYSDLSSNELEVIRELVSSEEEYNEMRSFYAGIDQLAISGREEVSVSVKSSLNSVFQAKHPGINQNWNAPAEATEKKIVPLYNRTLFRVAALLVLSAGVITVWISMSDGQLMNQKESITASSDSVPLKEQKAEPKKAFPLNEERKKEFTAASTIPADETVDQSVTVLSNATISSYDLSTSSTASSPSPAGKYKVAVSNANGSVSTFYYSSPKAPAKQSSALKAEKKEMIDDEAGSFAKAGLDADLNPGGFYAESGAAKDYKPSIKTTDLLTLIEPSF